MNGVDTLRLELAIKSSMSESFWDSIDFQKLVNNCEIINDNTAILVKTSNFIFIFDIQTYELMEGKGNDTIIYENDFDEEDESCQM